MEHEGLSVCDEASKTLSLDFHLLVYLPPYLLSLLVHVYSFMLGFFLIQRVLLLEECFLFVFPAIFHLNPVGLVGEKPLGLL